jgi:5-methyltetrahydropteroyltriglutamate--homocysteine methyltransferase
LQVRAYAPGIYPRSEALIQATRDLDRGRATHEAVAAQREADVRELIAAQEAAGLDLLTDGLLAAQDLFRPVAEASEGLDARPLTRFLDTNTFYRALLVDGEPRLRRPLAAPGLPAGRWLATLPAPSALTRSAGGALSPEAFAADVLAPQIESYAGAGCALVVLADPFLARGGDLEQAVAGLKELPRDVPFLLQLPFGDAARVLEGLANAPVNAIGVDFYATALDAVPESYPLQIAAGVVDSRSSAVESPEEVAEFAEQLGERMPAGLSLTVNGDLQFVPEPIARRKLACLGRARASLAQGVAA